MEFIFLVISDKSLAELFTRLNVSWIFGLSSIVEMLFADFCIEIVVVSRLLLSSGSLTILFILSDKTIILFDKFVASTTRVSISVFELLIKAVASLRVLAASAVRVLVFLIVLFKSLMDS